MPKQAIVSRLDLIILLNQSINQLIFIADGFPQMDMQEANCVTS